MKAHSKRPFSLLELMIVIFLISISATVIGIKINKVIVKYRFNRAYTLVLDKLIFAKQMALVNQADFIFKLKQEKNDLICETFFFQGSSCTNQKGKNFNKLSGINFYLIDAEPKREGKKIELFFSPSGACSFQGQIILFSKKTKDLQSEPINLKDLALKEKRILKRIRKTIF